MKLKIVLSLVILSAVSAFGQPRVERPSVGSVSSGKSVEASERNTLPRSSRSDRSPRFLLDEVISEVLSNNPSLKSARANWEARKQRVPQARAWEDPRVGVDVTAARFVRVSPNSFSDEKLMLEQTIPVTGKNRLRADAAGAEAFSAFQEFHRRELDLMARTRTAYFQLINAGKQVELTRKNIGLLKQFSEITRAKYEVGAQSQADVLQVETELGKLEETVFDFQRQISDAETQLNTLMNRPAQSPLALPAAENFQPVELSWENIEAFALTNRPELFIAQRKIEAAQARLELARRDWWPDPTFRIEADRYNQASQIASEVIVGVSINLPWFNRKKYDGAIRENKNMLESAEHDLEAARTETLGIVKNALKKVQTFHRHSELFRSKLLPLAQATLNSKRLNYETDKANFLDLLTAQRTLQDVESMYWNHLTDYQIAVAELEALVGGKMELQNPVAEKTKEKK